MNKKIILLILILLISTVSACNGKSERNNASNTIPSETNYYDIIVDNDDNVFELTSIDFFFANVAVLNGYDYSSDRESWENIIREKFSIELEVHSLYTEHIQDLIPDFGVEYTEEQYEYFKELIKDGQITGLFRFANADILPRLIEDNLIIPMSPYLENNSNWNSLPSIWKDVYSYNGLTWGVPTFSYTNCYSRYYRGDWLQELEINVPNTIENFYDVLKAFTYDDPDRDGLNNTRGADRDFGIGGLEDIFTAYDARPNPEGYFLPTLNPNSGVWEDSFIKPEFKEAMGFLIACEQEGVIAKSEFHLDGVDLNDFERGIAGSFGSNNPRYEFADSSIKEFISGNTLPSIVYTPGLIHTIDDNLCGVYTNFNSPYVLLASSKHSYSTLNLFIDVFISNREGYLLGHYGPDEWFAQNGDIVVRKTYEYDNKHFLYSSPRILDKNPIYSEISIPEHQYNKETNEYTLYNSNNRLASLAENDLCYNIPYEVLSPDYGIDTAQVTYLKDLSSNLVSWVLDGNIDLDSAIEQYKNKAKSIGMQDFLDEQNERLGKVSNQHY